MSFWKIFTSPGGVVGCRASMESAVKLNIRRANQGSPFARRGAAVSLALASRYRVVRRPFDPDMMLFEAAPLAWLDDARLPQVVAEYVVDQEFSGKAAVWLGEMMPDLLHEFMTTPDYEVRGAVGGIFLGLSTDRFMPHWGKWLRSETLEVIHDVAREHLMDRHPHLFQD